MAKPGEIEHPTKPVKGYKAFNSKLCCKDFQYEVGGTYTYMHPISLCSSGFHFCRTLSDCFKYYNIKDDIRIAEVVATGDMIKSREDSKCVTNRLTIVREITKKDVLKMCNIGDRNTGICNIGSNNHGGWNIGNDNAGIRNSGNGNTGSNNYGDKNEGSLNFGDFNLGNGNMGDRNRGCGNLGDGNVGDGNKGSSNIGNFNYGYGNIGSWCMGCCNLCDNVIGSFNTVKANGVRLFNQPYSELTVAVSPELTLIPRASEYFSKEIAKVDSSLRMTMRTALKLYRKSFKRALEDSTILAIEQLLKTPNFDYKIFKQITGITKRSIYERFEREGCTPPKEL